MTLSAGARSSGVAVDHANREKDDFYPTPPSAVLALLAVEQFDGAIWEPACGNGAISKVLIDSGYKVISSDLVARGYGEDRVDFLMEYQPRAPNIITNPPFKMVAPFMRQCLHLSTGKVALLLRLACLEGKERRTIYDSSPLARIWVFSERISMSRNGDPLNASGTLAFAWFVWEHSYEGRPQLGWI